MGNAAAHAKNLLLEDFREYEARGAHMSCRGFTVTRLAFVQRDMALVGKYNGGRILGVEVRQLRSDAEYRSLRKLGAYIIHGEHGSYYSLAIRSAGIWPENDSLRAALANAPPMKKNILDLFPERGGMDPLAWSAVVGAILVICPRLSSLEKARRDEHLPELSDTQKRELMQFVTPEESTPTHTTHTTQPTQPTHTTPPAQPRQPTPTHFFTTPMTSPPVPSAPPRTLFSPPAPSPSAPYIPSPTPRPMANPEALASLRSWEMELERKKREREKAQAQAPAQTSSNDALSLGDWQQEAFARKYILTWDRFNELKKGTKAVDMLVNIYEAPRVTPGQIYTPEQYWTGRKVRFEPPNKLDGVKVSSPFLNAGGYAILPGGSNIMLWSKVKKMPNIVG